jgi:hypothetical protein
MNSQGTSPSDWLIGKWQSDRSKTIEAWGDFPPGSSAFQASILRDLGRLVIKYDGQESTSECFDSTTTKAYRVAWQSADSAFVVTIAEDEEFGQHIHFASPVLYWVHTGRFVEYFSKVADA